MKAVIWLIIPLFVSAPLKSQHSSETIHPGAVVATLDGEPVTAGELASIYDKNQEPGEPDPDGMREFLPDYIEYRLKLRYGTDQGIHKEQDILEEFEQYGREAAYSYWLENEIKQLIIETYRERALFELKAFHILREVPGGTSPEDTTRAYELMMEAREKLLSGIPANEINETYSSVRHGNPAGGDLPWITAGRTVQSFEDALFSLDTGDISMPVRTEFGYHVIILKEKRARSADRKLRHILIQKNQEDAKQLVQTVYDSLAAGADWNEIARQFSDDGSSSDRGGQIGWVGYAMQFPDEFVKKVMKLSPRVPFSPPLELSYGYHIVRIDSVRTYTSDDHFEDELISELQRLGRFTPDRNQVHQKLLATFDYELYSEHLDELHKLIIQAGGERSEQFAELDEISGKPLVTFHSETYTIGHFFDFLSDEGVLSDFSADKKLIYDDYLEKILHSQIIGITKDQFPGFKEEMGHFLDGLIVFRVNEQNIWNQQTVNTAELIDYFHANREAYQLDRQFHFYRISTVSDSLIVKVKEKISAGRHPEKIMRDFAGLSVTTDSVSNRYSDSYERLSELDAGGSTDIIQRGYVQYIYYLERISEPRLMTFDEAFNRVTNDYIPVREKNFLTRLKEKYPVKMYPENITSTE